MGTVLVTGGTGTLGREVVTRVLARQHRARILSHQASPSIPRGIEVVTGDLASGRGLREASAGVDAIIHCATSFEGVRQVDVEGTHVLLQAAHASGSPHIVYISIVGVDRTDYFYYRGKYETELVVEQGPLPWTIVRATQYHNFVLQLIQSFGADTLSEVPVPGVCWLLGTSVLVLSVLRLIERAYLSKHAAEKYHHYGLESIDFLLLCLF